MIHFTSALADFNNSLWGYYIPVPTETADEILSRQEDRRVVCTLNGKQKFQCALMPNGEAGYYILVNKRIRDQLKLKQGDTVNVQLEKDESEYGLPMPDELAEVLDTDPEGDRLFHDLTPGKQRNLLYIVGNVKSTDLRIHRALVVVEHLKDQGGKIDFKLLQQELKASNRRF
jgi:hypothetical protein